PSYSSPVPHRLATRFTGYGTAPFPNRSEHPIRAGIRWRRHRRNRGRSSELSLDQEQRAPANFVERTPNVLSQHPHRHEVQSTHEQDNGHQRTPTFYRPPEELVDEHADAVNERCSRGDDPEQ